MPSDMFPLPALTPLTQLNVQDNLRINAERWELAHHYHRQRQNVHYQSLWQPGIVYGLGVKLITPPDGTASQFQAKSWIEVQPGLAIDGEGNPIVVGEEQDRTYPVTIPPLTLGVQTLYIVIRHVDPRHLELPNSTDRLQEQFRFDQRVNRLEPRDIELCRIRIGSEHSSQSGLAMPQGLQPALGQLDLTHRRFAQVRSQRSLTLGILPNHQHHHRALNALLQGMQVLYPNLHGQLQTVTPTDIAVDAICLDGTSLMEWHRSEDPRHSKLLQATKGYSGNLIIVADRFDQAFHSSVKRLQRSLNLQPVVPPHEITRQPFLFGKLPDFPDETLSLWVDDRIVIVPSAILPHWEGKEHSRSDIRTWHELGINLLYYVWYNSHIRKLFQ
ncbi:MAG: hypothetical protein AAF572_10130 [Cyanobacteria bacterium P01_B01_bin.77]